MGATQALAIDAWLREGGVVITASDRAARAIAAAYHRARLSEGRKAWTAPEILSWQHFALREWEQRSTDGRLVLNTMQERALWTEIVAAGGHAAATLAASRHRLAGMAMEAHTLVCSYAARFLKERARGEWTNDAAAFREWLAGFEEACRDADAVSPNRVPLELIAMLKADERARAPLLLAGFDRVLPVQFELFEAWGDWRLASGEDEATAAHFYSARDRETELAACALWCRKRLEEKPDSKLLVVTQDAGTRRGEIERVFLDQLGWGVPLPFEFSLGVQLGEVAIARSAMMMLRWLDGALQEHEVDWLLSSGHAVNAPAEAGELQARMRDLRRRKKQRTQWTLRAFVQQNAKPAIPPGWGSRMRAAQQLLESAKERSRGPLEWAELAPRLLNEVGWPGSNRGESAQFQAMRRLQQSIEVCGSLGFNGRQMPWSDFLAELQHAFEETLFSPESEDAPILIAGPSESAGLHADAIWFLGAGEDAWPAKGSLHPFLPAAVQRETGMPHATPQLDWELAREITLRVTRSAAEICFSHAMQMEGADVRPSRVVIQVAGTPEPLPMALIPAPATTPLIRRVEDDFAIPLRRADMAEGGTVAALRGGATVLRTQSHCPFKAFATGRLGADEWDSAQAGLTALERGNLLHAVMKTIWGGPPRGIRTLDELRNIADRKAFVGERVAEVLAQEMPEAARELMPAQYLELEVRRLTRLVTEWLEYEAARLPFSVASTEMKTVVEVGDLTLELRLDRIDRLNDGSLLVVDYKSGDVAPKLWDVPRPEDPQLPLYGGFGIEPGGELGGIVFAKIRAGDASFAGRVGDAAATLGGRLENFRALMKSPLGAEQLMEWRDEILRLSRDYVDGRADVDPRDPRLTCNRCGLHALCRIQEKPPIVEEEEDEEEADE